MKVDEAENYSAQVNSYSLAPWRAQERLSGSENHKGWLIFSGLNGVVAEVYPLNEDPTPDAKGNARLIAAAPALYEALKDALSAMEMQEGRELGTLEILQPVAKDIWDEAKSLARAAITSAEGKPQSSDKES